MNALEQMNLIAKPTKKEKKPDRPTIPVPNEAVTAFVRYAGATALEKIMTARAELEESTIKEVMIDSFANTLFKIGTQPANPRLIVEKNDRPDITGLFQVQNRYKLNVEEGDNPISQRIISSLVKANLPLDNAKSLVDNEIDTTNEVGIRPFNELVHGHYIGKSFVPATEAETEAATKLMNYVMNNESEPLTDDERKLITYNKENAKVKEGFMERIKSYAKSTEDVKAILKIITPVNFVSHINYGVNDTPEELVVRLNKDAANIIGV